MATIRKRIGKNGNESFYVEIRLKNHKKTTKTFKNEEEAKLWAGKTELMLKNNEKLPKLKLNHFIERFEIEVLPTLNNKYNNSTKSHLNYWKECLGEKYATEISSDEIEHFANELYKKGLSPETRRKYLVDLSKIFNMACKFWKWAIINPVSSTDTHKDLIKKSQGLNLERKINQFTEFKKFKLQFSEICENKIKKNGLTKEKIIKDLCWGKSMLQNCLNPIHNSNIGSLIKLATYLQIQFEVQEIKENLTIQE